MGFVTKKEKIQLFKTEVKYLGHCFSKDGLKPLPDRVEAIREAKTPENLTELRSFLGSVNYYGRFIPHLQTICAPLHLLERKGAMWRWSTEAERAFREVKEKIATCFTLNAYDANLPLIMATDASNIGVGAILLQQADGRDLPIAAVSRKLTKSEVNLSTIDKEAVAVMFGIRKFHDYIYGRKFLIQSDSRVLSRILDENSEIPKHTASRLAHYAITLSGYNYKIRHKPGKENAAADALSRLPMEKQEEFAPTAEDNYSLFNMKIEDLELTKRNLKRATWEDKELVQVVRYLRFGWPDKKNINPNLHTYYEKRDELSIIDDILIWRDRVIIPETLRKAVMEYLHRSHPGIVQSQSLAKTYVYWPRINRDLEEMIKQCNSCQRFKNKEPETPLNSWNLPQGPWQRVHLDFKGPFKNRMWLVVIDAYSRWLEIKALRNATVQKTMEFLRELMSRHGIPKQLVTDNGPQFRADEFKTFTKENNIIHIRSTPYHSRTNGLAEPSHPDVRKES